MFIKYSNGTIVNVWQNTGVFNGSQSVNGSFTTPTGVTSFQVGTAVTLYKGYLEFSGVTLTAYSAALSITAGDTYQFTGQVAGALAAPLGQGGRIVAAYANAAGQSAGEDLLWQNPTNFNGTLAVQQTVTANANATTLRLALTAVLDAGHLDFGDFNRQRLTAGAVIRRSTYMLAGTAMAVRVTGDPDGNDGLHYLYSDHASALLSTGLGSASLLVNSSNNPVAGSRAWYLPLRQAQCRPFGGYRPGSAPTQTITDCDFTGQRENMELGLLYYQARFYVPAIGRFASADTIVPDPARPQSYNRYSYVLNRALNFTDPTGHRECGASDDCSDPLPSEPQPPIPIVTNLWINPEDVTKIQLYGNTETAFYAEIGTSSYAYSQGFHGGLDLLASPGTTVVAGIHGKVLWVENGAYKPNYVVIEIAPNAYIVLGHLSGVQVQVGQVVTPDDVVGAVADRTDVDHLHVEFWTGSGGNISPRTIKSPYQYMSPKVESQFLELMTNMAANDRRITFHYRSDGMWSSIYDQPDLIYNGSNLSVGQLGYVNPWP